MKLNTPPSTQKPIPIIFFSLGFVLNSEFPLPSFKTKHHHTVQGKNKVAPFICLSIFWVNIASLFSPGNTFHLCFRDGNELMESWEDQSCEGILPPRDKSVQGPPCPPWPCSQSSAPPLAAEGSKNSWKFNFFFFPLSPWDSVKAACRKFQCVRG